MEEAEEKNGIGQGIENKYYDLLDWLDEKGIPVYAIVDPIDRFVPSLLIWFLLIAGILAFAFFSFQEKPLSNRIVFVDSQQAKLEGVAVELQTGSGTQKKVSDSEGAIVFDSKPLARIELKATKAGFNSALESLVIGKEALDKKIVLTAVSEEEVFSIRFVSLDNQAIQGKKISFSLSCSNPSAVPKKTDFSIDSDQSALVSQPKNCGSLMVTIQGPSEFRLLSYPVSSANPIVKLESAAAELADFLGSLSVFVESDAPSGLLGTNPRATLFRNNRLEAEKPVLQGVARFQNLVPGVYSVLVWEPESKFAQTRQTGIAVESSQEQKTTVKVLRDIVYTIRVQVKNQENGNGIENALVRLVNADKGEVWGEAFSQKDGSGQMALAELPEGSLELAVWAQGFFSTTVALQPLTETQLIELKPILDSASSGKVVVTVENEAGERIENGRVFLLDGGSGNVRQDIPFQTTDSKGEAVLVGVPAGKYIAWAEKGFDTGTSEKFDATESEIARIMVRLKTGLATVQVFAVDEDRNPIARALVSVFNAEGNEIESFELDETGTGSTTLKANQRVSIQVQHPNFLVFKSPPLQLFSDSPRELHAVLKKKSDADRIGLEFRGFVDAVNRPVKTLESNKLYLAVFDLVIPNNQTYSQAGAFFRLAEKKGALGGKVLLDSLRASNAELTLGKSFNPADGEAVDLAFENLVSSDGIWGQAVFSSPQAELRRIEVAFKAGESIPRENEWILHFNAWGVQEAANKMETFPLDSEVASGSKERLYANSNQQELPFSALEERECLPPVCFSGIEVVEKDSGKALEAPFQLRKDQLYELGFRIENRDSKDQDSISFSMANKKDDSLDNQIQINQFSLKPPNEDAMEQTVNGFETIPIVFNLPHGTNAEAKAELQANPIYWSRLVLKAELLSGKTIEQSIDFQAAPTKQFKWLFSPQEILPNAPVEIHVAIADAETEEAVQDATISLQHISPDGLLTEESKPSDATGNAVFNLPASSPNSKIVLEISKNGFETVQIEKTVPTLLEFSPNQLEGTLGPGADKAAMPFTIENQSKLEFKGKKAGLDGTFSGVVDETALQTALDSFAGTLVSKQQEAKTTFFALQLNPDYSLDQAHDFTGNLQMEFEEKDSKHTYLFGLPVILHALPNQSPLVAAQSCIEIKPVTGSFEKGKPSWNDTTKQNKAIQSFFITNRCKNSSDQSIEFDSLQAGINWNSENWGNVEIRVESEALELLTQTQTLKPNQWNTIQQGLVPNVEYKATLTFTPKENSLGKLADFKIRFAGKKAKNRELSDPIESKILIANLEDCLMFSPKPQERIEIPFNGEQRFSIDSSLCGKLPQGINISLCANDEGCGGGASKGKLEVNPKQFELNQTHPKQEISVKPKADDKLPGAYGIGISVQIPGGNATPPITTMNVMVNNDPSAFFALDKFEFFVKNNGEDSATLTNSHVSQRVSVKAKASDWRKIAKPDNGGVQGTQDAGTGTDQKKIEAVKPALQQANTEAQRMAADTANKLDAARKAADQAMQSQNNASQQTDQAKQGADQAMGMGSQVLNSAANLNAECPADTKGFCAAVCTITGGLEKILKQGVDKISGALSNLFKAKDSMGTVISGHPGETGTPPGSYAMPDLLKSGNAIFLAEAWLQGSAVQAATQAQNQANQGRADAAVEATADTSQGASNASQQLKDSCLSNQNAAQLDKKAQDESGKAGNNFSMSQVNLGMAGVQMGTLAAALKACPFAATMFPKYAVLKGMASGLDGANLTANQQTDTAKGGQQQAELASTAASGAACLASDKLRDFSQATPVVSDDAGGASGDIQQDLAVAGSGQGILDGLNQGVYQDEWVTNTIGGFNINLVKDWRSVDVLDEPAKTAISGRFNVEKAAVSDTYRKQQVGIRFANSGMDQEQPVYSTVRIAAVNHEYPTGELPVPEGFQDWGIYRLEGIQGVEAKDYAPEFHLKFNPSEKSETGEPKSTNPESCVQGALIGETGEESLPKVKLSWQWKDIQMDSCADQKLDGKPNEQYFYCDATQFSIMVLKRVHALEDFLTANPNLPCPTNQYQVQLDNEMQPFNQFLIPIGGSTFKSTDYISQCWLPESTEPFDGKASLEYFVEEAANNVNWTSEIHNRQELHDLLFFNAHLIQDGFTEDFFSDFSRFYTEVNLLDTPAYFYMDSQGRNYNKYLGGAANGLVAFQDKFTEAKRLPTSGLYQIELLVQFGKNWQLFDMAGNPSGKIGLDWLAKEQAESSNPFYYIPFDGGVGLENNKLKREGYGVQFQVKEDDVFSISRETKTRTWPSESPNPIQVLSIDRQTSFAQLNGMPSQRGFILDLKSPSDNEKTLSFTPSLATPLVLKFQHEKTLEPFGGFFSIRQEEAFETTGENLGYWSGMGKNCQDFEGKDLIQSFREIPDRKATEGDRGMVENWEYAYGLDWKEAKKTGIVFLKTIFYTPPKNKYTLQSESKGLEFLFPDQEKANAIDLQGINSMEFNRGNQSEQDQITALDDLFELVKQKSVCITNSGSHTSYWWNPQELYKQTGKTQESINSLETKAEASCVR